MLVMAKGTFGDVSKLAPLFEAEVAKAHELQEMGVLVSAWRNVDRKAAYLVFKVNDIDEARAHCDSLPFVEAGLLTFDYAEVAAI
jgi:muconolactone delta-isomerase